ncbi:MAG TPA: wax ester/triacylglycerol synthase domain-containing protein, partial [Trebonia sp.]
MSIAADPPPHDPVPIRAEDALFLYAQTPFLCQQVGAVLVLEPAAVNADQLRDAIRARVRAVPELRRRLEVAAGWWQRPYWVADDDIDFTERVREVVLDQGGNSHTICGVVDGFFSRWC